MKTGEQPDDQLFEDKEEDEGEDAIARVEGAATGDTEFDFEDIKYMVTEFIDTTGDARAISERCRDYYDGHQWTEAQVQELKRRKQAPIVNNRIKVKHNGLLGLMSMRKGDPQAFPRNADADSGAAEAATDGLRYAADQTTLNTKFASVADNYFCEGYGGVQIIEETMPDGSVEILVDNFDWDRLVYDPYSRKPDFSDAKMKGYLIWMDQQDIVDAFPDADPDALSEARMELETDDTFEDKPTWFRSVGKRKRHLVATIYFEAKGVWMMTIFTGSGFLVKPFESPYLDKYGQPECPIEMQSAYTKRDGTRGGELESFLDLQDEINHRRSKALFLLSQRQTFGNRGSVRDVKAAKRELAKPNGHLEVGQGEFGKDFGVLPTGDMAQGQFELLQESKQEMDGQSYNAQLAGERSTGDLSGKAIGKLQQAGVIELNTLFEQFSAFKLRVYRQMWNRIRQFWDEEKWVRVTDDEKALKWVGFNVPVSMKEALQDIMDDETKPHEMRVGASAQMIMLEKTNPQALEDTVYVKNRPAELDMDIILDESADVINASEEQLQAILTYGLQSGFELVDLLEISNIKGKQKLIDKINSRKQEAAQAAGDDPQMKLLAATAADKAASAQSKTADAEQTTIENDMLKQSGGMVPFKGTVSA